MALAEYNLMLLDLVVAVVTTAEPAGILQRFKLFLVDCMAAVVLVASAAVASLGLVHLVLLELYGEITGPSLQQM